MLQARRPGRRARNRPRAFTPAQHRPKRLCAMAIALRPAPASWHDDVGPVDKSQTILVIDDVPTNVRLLEAVLGAAGYDVVSATSGPEGLVRVAGGGIDLVLVDVNMPGMTGHEVCRRIREAD